VVFVDFVDFVDLSAAGRSIHVCFDRGP